MRREDVDVIARGMRTLSLAKEETRGGLGAWRFKGPAVVWEEDRRTGYITESTE